MAGDAWVMDIIWHTMIISGKWAVSFWRQWSTELLLGASFVTQLVLSLSAGFRWRGTSTALRRVIWFFYVGAEYVATTALGHLSISGSSGERQLVAFWAPFFLLHLGGPDNITAYQFEDNQLSMRSVLQLGVQVLGTLIIVYNSISGSWALILAAWIMLFVGVTKYVERTLALQRANLGNIRRSLKLKGQHRRHHHNLMFAAGDDTALLMRAHSLFHVCKHVLVDTLVEEELDDDEATRTREELFDIQWYQQLKVMEIELSLMYEFLYTKASVIYSWHGYGIRALSPVAILGALVLVELSNQGGRHQQSDVVITRVLLAATFVLETVSLLRALGSSWTGFLICTQMRPAWIRHEFFCNSQWHRFRRAIASLGLLADFRQDSHQVADDKKEHLFNNHRRWSCKIGQLNLFQRITSCGPLEKDREDSFWAGSHEEIKADAKRVVYRKVRHKVLDFRAEMKKMGRDEGDKKVKLAAQLSTKWGQQTLKDYGLGDLRDTLGKELQVGILTWHIGTNIFLDVSDMAAKQQASMSGKEARQHVEAVRTLSNYMMHLLSERPHMLPGVVTRQLLEQTRRDLDGIWNDPKHAEKIKVVEEVSNSKREQQLSRMILRLLHTNSDSAQQISTQQINTYLNQGIRLGLILVRRDKDTFFKDKKEKGMVKVILKVWVDMLFHASYRCSKESHAKQLAYGGELTTIVWLWAEHGGLFVVPRSSSSKKQGDGTGTGDDSKSSSQQVGSITTAKQQNSLQPGEVMIQLHPSGLSSSAYDFHQNYM